MDILDLLASDNYIPYNRTLAKEIGIESAILFGALCGYQRHYKSQEFYREQANIIEDTCLTEYAIRQATKILQDKGLIIVIKKGMPAKNYYQINTQKLLEYLSTSGIENNTTGGIENISTSGIENNTTIYKNNNKNNNKINKETISEMIGSIQSTELAETLKEFLEMRKKIKKPMTDYAFKLLLNKLYKLGKSEQEYIDILNQSIEHSWQDIYELKNKQQAYQTSPPPVQEQPSMSRNNYTKEQVSSLYTDLSKLRFEDL